MITIRTPLDPHAIARQIYGPDRQAYGMQWKRYKRLRQTPFHILLEEMSLADLTRPPFDIDAAIREVVPRVQQRFPRLTIHAWAVWPSRLEFLIDGARIERSVGLGQIKGALTRRYRTLDRGPFFCSCSYGIPLLTASERLCCLNHLRRQMMSLEQSHEAHGREHPTHRLQQG